KNLGGTLARLVSRNPSPQTRPLRRSADRSPLAAAFSTRSAIFRAMAEQALAHSVARVKGSWFFGFLVFAAACHAPAEQKAEPVAANTTAQPAAGYKLYGAALDPTLEPVSLGDVLSKPGDFEGKTVRVDAKVRRACSQKGCW